MAIFLLSSSFNIIKTSLEPKFLKTLKNPFIVKKLKIEFFKYKDNTFLLLETFTQHLENNDISGIIALADRGMYNNVTFSVSTFYCDVPWNTLCLTLSLTALTKSSKSSLS